MMPLYGGRGLVYWKALADFWLQSGEVAFNQLNFNYTRLIATMVATMVVSISQWSIVWATSCRIFPLLFVMASRKRRGLKSSPFVLPNLVPVPAVRMA